MVSSVNYEEINQFVTKMALVLFVTIRVCGQVIISLRSVCLSVC